ncbi:disulfide bond formation protein B [Rhizosaccharibacter radicis]|uniref:Disulfide bond formation protein B n=1 Tax=Rhizosaccharibacter radicis TaxID=2782605 RepID=A0ABT1VZE3_9PROT|nr:disulfide bond formation protein B [Acetobacteraceae bacterium KSS12]
MSLSMRARRDHRAGGRIDGLFWVAAGAVILGGVWWEEHVRGLVPCALCLLERWPWRALVLLGLLRLGLPDRPGISTALRVAAAAVLLAAAGLGLTHLGVEQHWWPDPLPQCQAPTFHAGSLRERLASMPLRPAKPCDSPSYLLPGLPVSMAALDMLFALALLALTLFLGFGRKRPA